MKTLIFFVILLFCVNSLQAQEPAFGNWFVYLGNKQFNEQWNWEQSVQYRNFNFIGDLHQLLVRNGIGYNLTEDNNNISLGYDYILDQQYDALGDKSIENNEHRIYQQFITKQRFGRFYLKHRYRFEERFINSAFKFRFRYALFFNIPINHKDFENNTWYVSAYNELFLTNTNNRFDQNWLYGGLGYKINKTLSMELGYMNQSFVGNNRDQLNILTKLNF